MKSYLPHLVSNYFIDFFWDIYTWQLLDTKPEIGGFSAFAWSPDGHIFASVEYDSISLRDSDTRQRIYELKEDHPGKLTNDAELQDLAWSPDGQLLASVSRIKTLCLWDIQTRQIYAVLKGHSGSVYCRMVP